jgi:hypothetical protein
VGRNILAVNSLNAKDFPLLNKRIAKINTPNTNASMLKKMEMLFKSIVDYILV